MEKSNHIEEIRNTRVGGFGGSDAAMLVAIAKRIAGGQPLTTTQKHRVRVAKGLEPPPPPFSTPEIDAGRAFENEVAAELKGWSREQLLTPLANTMTEPRNFSVFAHADYYDFLINGVKECKWSRKFDHKGLQKEYRWQLQWYYMLGADSVSMVTDTADGREVSDIKRNRKDVETLRNAVAVLDAAWNDLNLTITEFRPNELPPEITNLYSEIEGLAAHIKTVTETLDAKKAILQEWMENNATAIEGEQCNITYTPASHTVGFDTKKFEAEHADLFAARRLINKLPHIPEGGAITVMISHGDESLSGKYWLYVTTNNGDKWPGNLCTVLFDESNHEQDSETSFVDTVRALFDARKEGCDE